jgi:hypothetical protein
VPNYDPFATVHTGTIDLNGLVIGDFLGRSATRRDANFWGDSGAIVGWDDFWANGIGHWNTNADALDGLWVQCYLPDAYWFELSAPVSTLAVFTSQDHGPYVAEGLEYRVYGANTLWDDSSLGPQAKVTDIYLDGWRPHNPAEDLNKNGWQSDDVTGVFDLGGTYRYIKITAWSDTGPFNEPEIDAVGGAPVPEASTLMLFGSGLPGVAIWVRSRRRRTPA